MSFEILLNKCENDFSRIITGPIVFEEYEVNLFSWVGTLMGFFLGKGGRLRLHAFSCLLYSLQICIQMHSSSKTGSSNSIPKSNSSGSRSSSRYKI